jgi:hypothetical protein
MTGAERGACEPITGTPYVGGPVRRGRRQRRVPAGEGDFPQPLEGAPGSGFSVSSPARQAQTARADAAVTGTRYEQGAITGPFGMGTGKITGTEQFRFDRRQATAANPPDGAVGRSRPPAQAAHHRRGPVRRRQDHR